MSQSTCINGSAAVLYGAGGGVCTSDPRPNEKLTTTYNVNALVGGGGGTSLGKCVTYTAICSKSK